MTVTSTAIHVTCEVEVTSPASIEPETFHRHSEALADQLMAQEEADDEIADTTLGGDAGRRIWTIELLVLTDDPFQASIKALSVIRSAIHSLGNSTAGWPTADDIRSAFAPSIVQSERTLIPA